jgi:hypothetical protein
VPGIGHLHLVLHTCAQMVWEENGPIWKPWEDEELHTTESVAELRLYVTRRWQVLCVVMLV